MPEPVDAEDRGAAPRPEPQRLASWRERALAGIIDHGPIATLWLVGVWLVEASGPQPGWLSLASLAPFVAALLLADRHVRATSAPRQTLGRRLLRLRVIDDATGSLLPPRQAGLRYFLHVLDNACIVGWLAPLWTRRRETIADRVTGSIVVRVSPDSGSPDPNRLP